MADIRIDRFRLLPRRRTAARSFGFRISEQNASFFTEGLHHSHPARFDEISGGYGLFSENLGFLAVNRKQRRAAKSQGEAIAGRAAPAMPAGSSPEIAERFAAALSHHQAGRLAQAESLYRQVCAENPYHADGLHFLGVLAGQMGRSETAIDLIGRALAIRPDYAEAHYNLGHILATENRLDQAGAHYKHALALMPHSAEVHNRLGTVLSDQGKSSEAIACFERALALKPDFAEAAYNQGIALKKENRLEDAVKRYERALAINPDYPAALNNRGNALHSLNRPTEALASFDKALAINPKDPEAWNNRGVVLIDVARCAEALASFDRALAIRQDYASALNNRAAALRSLGRPAEALASLERAVAVDPDNAEARFNRGCTLLLRGHFDSGWQDYEWRWKTAHLAGWRRDFSQPLWLGEQALEGRTILLHAEQGFGDAIQFVRYVPLVAARGGRVVLEVQSQLKPLFSRAEGASLVVDRGEALPGFDCHCPLASLPLAFKTGFETIPSAVPYLSALEERLAKWQSRLPETGRPRIGIAWGGNPGFRGDATRSIGLARLSPLFALPGVTFVGLQKDLRSGDRELLGQHPEVVHVGDTIEDFEDTAAIVSLVDLVISSDTSIVHLAGALGKPVWILLQCAADWRWLTERADSPWYPTARLFRQPKIDDWETVVRQIRHELAQ